MYGPSHMGWNFPSARLVVFLKTLLKTNCPSLNVCSFTRRLSKLANLYWYDATRTTATSRSSSAVSRSLITASVFASSGVSIRIVGILIFIGMITSIPYVRVNGDSPVSFQLVVLKAHNTLGSSSTHFSLAECRCFFKADRSILLDAFSWPFLCGYHRVEYRFLIFNSLQNFLYTDES